MYSGTTLTKYSGRVLGAHQKIDRVARRQLKQLLVDNDVFPKISSILQFEGRNGPDGIKIKSPAQDEPWHYYNPFDEADNKLINIINEHYKNLVKELGRNNKERAAFEAAWLAHALVDGLTPAHHYPYEEKLLELMDGKGLETRTSILKKNIISGSTKRDWLSKNWQMWGAQGLRTAHGLFEIGVSTLIAPLRFSESQPDKEFILEVYGIGIDEHFKRTAREIAILGIFDSYLQKGWTPKLASRVRHKLGPELVQIVTVTWYCALLDAKIIKI